MPDPIIPTIGRIVYYRGKDGEIRPAIITHVWGVWSLSLHVFGKDPCDTEAGTHINVTLGDPVEEPGCFPSWHWMPFQKQQAAAAAPVPASA